MQLIAVGNAGVKEQKHNIKRFGVSQRLHGGSCSSFSVLLSSKFVDEQTQRRSQEQTVEHTHSAQIHCELLLMGRDWLFLIHSHFRMCLCHALCVCMFVCVTKPLVSLQEVTQSHSFSGLSVSLKSVVSVV